MHNVVQELLNDFCTDVYGNVVSLHAVTGSLAAFSSDHIFPWCVACQAALQVSALCVIFLLLPD